jgi:tripartite-type tricarboxylate transporter receptor subunit TctC
MRSTIRAGEQALPIVMHPKFTLSRRAALGALGALALRANAQAWPARPLRMIVPYPAGGISDMVARELAERLRQQLGQPVIVENRGGASGTIGMDLLAKSPPDGYTLAFSAVSPLTLSPALTKVPYDPERDFTPVCSVMDSPVVLLATSATTARDFRALLAYAKSSPDTVRWATSGLGSLGHIMLAQLEAAAGVRIVHIPYKGGGQMLTDALSGQFEVLSVNASPGLSVHIRAGKLRPLAVGAARRLESLPQVPTLAELGYPQANLSSHFGVFAPGNLPTRLLDRLNGEINTALDNPALRHRLMESENLPTGGAARDFARHIAAEAQSTAQIVKSVGIHAES